MRIFILFPFVFSCTAKPVDEGLTLPWNGGDFDFQTISATDRCLGGALEVLFMPNGPETPHDFEYPIYLPSFEEVPAHYSIDLRAPFIGMEVTVRKGGEDHLVIRESLMESVALGEGTYGDCIVTMMVDAEIFPTSTSTAEGTADITISNPRGNDEMCPVMDDDPCRVTIGMTISND